MSELDQDLTEDDVNRVDDAAPAPVDRAAFQPTALLAGRYRVVRFIARGGMGEVYEVEDLELKEKVALKTIRSEGAQNSLAIERFRREIQLARKVTHPNVCRIFDVFHHRRTQDPSETPVTFLTMELLSGETLAERNLEVGAVDPSAIASFAQIRSTDARRAALESDAVPLLLVECAPRFSAQVNGRYRWTVDVAASIGPAPPTRSTSPASTRIFM